MSGAYCGSMQVGREPRKGPAAAVRPPLLLMRADAPFAQLLHHPVGRGEEARRIREARTIHVGQVEQVVHHLGVLQRLMRESGERRRDRRAPGQGGTPRRRRPPSRPTGSAPIARFASRAGTSLSLRTRRIARDFGRSLDELRYENGLKPSRAAKKETSRARPVPRAPRCRRFKSRGGLAQARGRRVARR